MALANMALYKKDTTRALRLYSRVKTPHAAWNQSQVNQFCTMYVHKCSESLTCNDGYIKHEIYTNCKL